MNTSQYVSLHDMFGSRLMGYSETTLFIVVRKVSLSIFWWSFPLQTLGPNVLVIFFYTYIALLALCFLLFWVCFLY